MVVAIDAVCDVALRIIGKLTQGPAAGGPPLFGSAGGGSDSARPPTPAMKRFAVAISRRKRIKLPPGYATSGSICRAFLEQHTPKKAVGETAAERGSKTAIWAQVSADESNQPVRKRRRSKDATGAAPAARGKTTRKPKFNGPTVNASPGLSRHDVGGNTPLKNSLRQQGNRFETWGPLRCRRLVCASWR